MDMHDFEYYRYNETNWKKNRVVSDSVEKSFIQFSISVSYC